MRGISARSQARARSAHSAKAKKIGRWEVSLRTNPSLKSRNAATAQSGYTAQRSRRPVPPAAWRATAKTTATASSAAATATAVSLSDPPSADAYSRTISFEPNR